MPTRVEVRAYMNKEQLLRAVRDLVIDAETLPGREWAAYDAELLEAAARRIRESIGEPETPAVP